MGVQAIITYKLLEERRGGGGVAGHPLLLWAPLPQRQRRWKNSLSVNPLAPKGVEEVSNSGRGGGGGGAEEGGSRGGV